MNTKRVGSQEESEKKQRCLEEQANVGGRLQEKCWCK